MLDAMKLATLLLVLAGILLVFWFSEGQFAGSAEDEARRVKFRRVGIALGLVGLGLLAWIDYG